MSAPQFPVQPTGNNPGGPTAPGGPPAPIWQNAPGTPGAPGGPGTPVWLNAPGGPTSKNIWGILALICGIVGIVLAWVILGGLFGILGVIFGIIGLSAVKRGTASNKALNIWGVILSAIAMVLTAIFLVVYVAIGVRAANVTAQPLDSSSESAPDDSASADPSETDTNGQSDDPLPATGGEFLIGPDLTMALAVRPEQLEKPTGFAGEEPNEQDYATAWGPAVETDGQIMVVTVTIRNSGSVLDTNNGSINLMSQSGDKEYREAYASGYSVNLFTMGGLESGGVQTFETAFAIPASEMDSVMVRVTLQLDMGEGRQFDIG